MDDSSPFLKLESVRKAVTKNSILLFPGEVPRAAYIVRRGVVKAYSIDTQGNERVVDFLISGEIFPISWIFNKISTTLYYYETLTDCQFQMVSKDVLNENMLTDQKLLMQLATYAISQYTTTQLRITALEQSRAGEKIMFTIYYLVHRYSELRDDGMYSLKLKLTHNLIADMIGLTRETTTFELNKLKRLGIIDYSSKFFLVDKTKLERLMGEDSFRGLT